MHSHSLFSYWKLANAHHDRISASKEQPFNSCSAAALGCSLMVSAPEGSASIRGRLSCKQASQWKKGKYNHPHLAEQKLRFIDINQLACNYQKNVCDTENFFQSFTLMRKTS